jgi:hypothetical protein
MRSIRSFVRRRKHWYRVLHCRKGFGRAGLAALERPFMMNAARTRQPATRLAPMTSMARIRMP